MAALPALIIATALVRWAASATAWAAAITATIGSTTCIEGRTASALTTWATVASATVVWSCKAVFVADTGLALVVVKVVVVDVGRVDLADAAWIVVMWLVRLECLRRGARLAWGALCTVVAAIASVTTSVIHSVVAAVVAHGTGATAQATAFSAFASRRLAFVLEFTYLFSARIASVYSALCYAILRCEATLLWAVTQALRAAVITLTITLIASWVTWPATVFTIASTARSAHQRVNVLLVQLHVRTAL